MKLIDNALFEDLCDQAEDSPRRRVHHLLHATHDDQVQRLVIGLQPGTYLRPHRHSSPPKWELIIVLKGVAAWIGFDEQGRVVERTEAGAHRDFKGLEYPPGTWHSLVCLAPDTVIFECKAGPFAPVHTEDFAPWAPEEDAEAAADYVRWMRRAKPGERFRTSDDGLDCS
jgi:cupin fold WbuC family metalloprotein